MSNYTHFILNLKEFVKMEIYSPYNHFFAHAFSWFLLMVGAGIFLWLTLGRVALIIEKLLPKGLYLPKENPEPDKKKPITKTIPKALKLSGDKSANKTIPPQPVTQPKETTNGSL